MSDSKPKAETSRDAPRGLWSDVPPKPDGPQRRSIAATPPPLPKSKLPRRPAPPPVPRHRPADMKLVVPPEADQTQVKKRASLAHPEDVSAEEAFRVEPATEEERAKAKPPPLPRPPAIPNEAKAAPAPLAPDEPSQERELPRLLLSSHPPPPPEDSGLRSPFDTPASVTPPAADGGVDPKSAMIGLAVGAVVVAIIAFVLWPRGAAPVADVNPSAGEPSTVDEPAAPDLEPAELARDEVAQDEIALDEAEPDEPEAEADEPEADEPEADEPEAVAARDEPPAARPRPQRRSGRAVAPDERSLPELRNEPPRTEPTVVERPATTGPAIAAETTPPPRAQPSDLPATPTRQDVANAITSIRSQLLECAPEHRGHIARIRFTFVSSGRATSALVPNDFATPQARSCVARVSRQARVPAFSDPRLVVTYPVTF